MTKIFCIKIDGDSLKDIDKAIKETMSFLIDNHQSLIKMDLLSPKNKWKARIKTKKNYSEI